MKKFLTAILTIFYLSTSTGASIHIHYCMGRLADWEIGNNTSKTCGECGMEKKDEKANGCCRDEHKFVKNNTDQKVAETCFQLMQMAWAALPVSFFEIPTFHVFTATKANPVSHAPPRSSSIAVYILNSTFLI